MTPELAEQLAMKHTKGEIYLTPEQAQKLLRIMLGGDEDEWDEEDEPVTLLQETTHEQNESDVLSELLVDMMCAATKLTVLLSEADEDEYKLVWPRLVAFKHMVESLPLTSRTAKKVVGFKTRPRKAHKTKPKGKKK